MKRVVAAFCCFIWAFSAEAADWYVRPNGAGLVNGSSWNNAWGMTQLNSNWSSVNAGDTVWLAGGTYTTQMVVGKSGTAGNIITIKRARDGNGNHGSDAGWDAITMDKQVVIAPAAASAVSFSGTSGQGSYVTIDGGVFNGIRAVYDNNGNNRFGAISFSGGGQSFVTLINCDFAGPSPGGYLNPNNFNYAADSAPLQFNWGSSPVTNITFSRCDIHGGPNLFYNGGLRHRNLVFEYCRFYDNSSGNGNIHANMFFNGCRSSCGGPGGYDWTFRYCDFSGWQVEGFANFDTGPQGSFWFYGNFIHDPAAGGARFIWAASDSAGNQSKYYFYNNTCVGVSLTTVEANAFPFEPTSQSRNNIFYNSGFTNSFRILDADYNFYYNTTQTCGGQTPCEGIHTVQNGTNPFVNITQRDYHIVATTGPTYPRDKGADLSSAGSQFIPDPDGNVRGADGFWDIGAYEYPGAPPAPTPSPTPAPPAAPTNLQIVP